MKLGGERFQGMACDDVNAAVGPLLDSIATSCGFSFSMHLILASISVSKQWHGGKLYNTDRADRTSLWPAWLLLDLTASTTAGSLHLIVRNPTNRSCTQSCILLRKVLEVITHVFKVNE